MLLKKIEDEVLARSMRVLGTWAIGDLRRLGRWVLVVGFVIVVFSLLGQCLPDRLLFQEGQFGRL